MLHIILVILKIAGILLATVLTLLLLAVLILLFVPLRYEAQGKYNSSEIRGKGEVTWLLHLVTLRFSFEGPGKMNILLKVLWFPLFPKPEKTRVDHKSGKRSKAVKSPAGKTARKNNDFNENSRKVSEPEPSRPVQEKVSPQKEKQSLPKESFSFSEKLNALKERILQFYKRLKRSIEEFFGKLSALSRNVEAFRRRADHYLTIWNEKETRAFLVSAKGYVRYALRHFGPRKARGFIRYGMADPALTGQLTGILYVLRPLALSELELIPDFEAQSFLVEGEISVKGHIRAFHAVKIGLKLLFDKNLKHIRQRIKE